MPTLPAAACSLFVLAAAVLAASAWPATADDVRHAITRAGRRSITEPPTPAERAVKLALDAVGTPVSLGWRVAPTGFDCSGLVRWAYGRVGSTCRTTRTPSTATGRRVPESGMAPGDILFFEGLGHVGLYLGRGRMVHAPNTGRNVEVVRLGTTTYGSRLIGARRVVAA